MPMIGVQLSYSRNYRLYSSLSAEALVNFHLTLTSTRTYRLLHGDPVLAPQKLLNCS
jgi:hypothetical protein